MPEFKPGSVVEIASVAAICIGVAFIYWPAAFIVGGVIWLALAQAME